MKLQSSIKPTKHFAKASIASLASLTVMASMALSAAPATANDSNNGALLPPITAPATVDTYIGQSVQVRQDADGNPNSNLIDFRWAATQVNAESLNGPNTGLPVPMNPAPLLRSLQGASSDPDITNDGVVYDFNDVKSVDTARTLNLWPQDKSLPAGVTAEFTLDGEKVQAQDLVGKGGVVTATYTVKNHTMKTENVQYKTIGGKNATKKVKTAQPMVAIAMSLLPQTWGQLNTGSGVVGADGRGNWQTQWIGLPFNPISDDATSQFGWTAVIPEGQGEIPKIMVNVAPLYIPSKDKEPKEKKSGKGGGAPGVEQIGAGAGVAASGATEMVKGIVDLVGTIGQAKSAIGAQMPKALADTKDAVAQLEKTLTPTGGNKLPTLPELITTLQATTGDLDDAAAQLRANGNNGELVEDLQSKLNLAATGVGLLDTYVNAANNYAKKSSCNKALDVACQANGTTVTSLYPTVTAALNAIDDALTNVAKDLPTTVGDIEADVIEEISATLKDVTETLQDLQIFLAGTLIPQVDAVGGGFGEIMGAINAGIAKLKEGAPADIGEISAGAGGLGSGLGILGGGAKDLIAYILTMVTAGEAALKEAASEVNTIKAEFAGLLNRAHESPLPYGGGQWTVYQPKDKPAVNVEEVSAAILSNDNEVPAKYAAYVQPTNELFGAYQFMMDPANDNKPDTLPRILIGIVALLLAGIALPFFQRRREAKAGS